MQRVLCAALSFFALAAGVRADEIRLKDGSKITGSIVGFEDGSFKVETAYGFAMIRKDSIAEIVPTAPSEAKPSAPKSVLGKPAEEAAPAAAKPATPAAANPAPTASAKPQPAPGKLIEAAEPKSQPAPVKPTAYVGAKAESVPTAPPSLQATSQQPVSQQPPSAPSTAKQLTPQSAAMPVSPASPQPVATAPNGASTPAPAPASASAPSSPAPSTATPPAAPVPSAPVEPPPVREMVRGSLYINQTYGFQMYRAPDWQPSIAARAALPNAIAALGTSDQSTLLIIGRDRAHDSLDAQSAATEKAVEEIYENYRPMPPQRITVAGVPAIERQFRGEAEHRDWSVILVTLEREGDVFTILAMTDANSELVQIQENVISKAIGSLQFTDPAAPAVPHT
jgi:hypothetical protein